MIDFIPNHTSDQHPWFVGITVAPGRWEARLVLLGGRRGRTRAQQLAVTLRRLRLGVGCADPAALPALLSPGAAGPQLAQSRGARGHGRRPPWVARSWRRRIPDRRFPAIAQGFVLAGQSGEFVLVEGTDPYDRLIPIHSTDQDDIVKIISELSAVLRDHPSRPGGGPPTDRVLLAEAYLPIPKLIRYHGTDGDGIQLPSNMNLLQTPWRPGPIAELIEEYEDLLPAGAWPNWVLGNHDRHRIASRLGQDQVRDRGGPVAHPAGHSDPLLRRRTGAP